jgi:hypothetical protein
MAVIVQEKMEDKRKPSRCCTAALLFFFAICDSRLTARPRFAQLSQHNGNKQEAKIEF